MFNRFFQLIRTPSNASVKRELRTLTNFPIIKFVIGAHLIFAPCLASAHPGSLTLAKAAPVANAVVAVSDAPIEPNSPWAHCSGHLDNNGYPTEAFCICLGNEAESTCFQEGRKKGIPEAILEDLCLAEQWTFIEACCENYAGVCGSVY